MYALPSLSRPRSAAVRVLLAALLFLPPVVFAGSGDLEPVGTRTAPIPGWGAPHAAFGASVAVAGDYAVVADSLRGIARISLFKRVGGEWEHRPGGGMAILLGSVQDMDFDGNRVIIGLRRSDPGQGGWVLIMRFNSFTEQWTPEYYASIQGNNPSYGSSVAIHGNQALVGMPTPAPGAAIPLWNNYLNQPGWAQLDSLPPGAEAVAFGTSVSVREHRFAVGDPGAPGGGRVRTWAQNAWSLPFQEQITRPGGSLDLARFGHRVALHGETNAQGQLSYRLLVGAPGDRTDTGPANMGRAYLYSRPSGTSAFTLIDSLAAPSPVAGDNFGEAVATDGVYALVGAPGRTVSGQQDRGQVFAARVSESGVQGGLTAMIDAQGSADDLLGTALAISDSGEGPRWMIGSPLAEANANPGQGIVLMGSGTVANPFPGTLRRVDLGQGLHEAHVGWPLSARDGVLVAGASGQAIDGDLRRGAVHAFTDVMDYATPPQRILAPDGGAEEHFGQAIAHNARMLVVGAPRRPEQGVYSAGAVYAYLRAPDGSWAFDSKLTDDSPIVGGRFGQSVAVLDDDTVLVVSATPNHLRRYRRLAPGVWTRTDLHQALGDGFSTYVVAEGMRVAYAEPRYSTGGAGKQGAVRMFEVQGGSLLGPAAELFGTQADQEFGLSVSLDGDRLAVLSQAVDAGLDKGRVQTYRQSAPPMWQAEASFPVQPLIRPPGYFGLTTVALNGDTLVVGSHTHLGTPDIRGGVFVYRFEGGQWQHRQSIGANELGSTQTFSSFGTLAWLDGTLFVGSSTRNFAFDGQGVIYLLRPPGEELFDDGFE